MSEGIVMSEASPWWVRANNHVLELAAGLGVLLVGLFKVVFPLLGVTGPLPPLADTRTVSVAAPATASDAAASGPVTLRGTGRAELVFHDPDFGDRLLLALPGVTGALLLVVVFYELLLMARTFHAADFFAPRNARHLLVIAGALLLIGTVPPALDVLTTHLLVDGTPVEPTVRTPYAMSTAAILGALLTAAAAAAFRRGTRLREDTEGLV
ncbi:DUF2975 domain-containing protein [Streptomyces huiliensis]|uniref:DUF2975 domain-containing protein n=1 Tax=Streptomyces huiliensis TaxID=2876027 RepID=UPI001CBDB84E|nr:DUF2975 domain-containing protein [Streptomyces huiliensis]MBZ4320149.1 DUF2975 domain-containing protein [Streptomyces huiliensis]